MWLTAFSVIFQIEPLYLHHCKNIYGIEIEHGLTSASTQYRLYGRRFFTGQKTQPTVSKYWRRKL